jgi:transposase
MLKKCGLRFSRAIGTQLRAIVAPLLLIHEQVVGSESNWTVRFVVLREADETTKRLVTVPSVGVVTASTFWHTVDDPLRFSPATNVGAIWAYAATESGEFDTTGKISRWGDRLLRSIGSV